MRHLALAGLLLAAVASSSSAGVTYTASRAVGSGSVVISITTDGTTGVLATANILDWAIAMTDGPDSFTLLGPLGGPNSRVLVAGNALTATATDLLFNYDAGGAQFALFQSPVIGSGQFFYSFQTAYSFDALGPAEAIDPRADYSYVRAARRGELVIASVAPNAVPEPSTFAMAGLAGIGGRVALARRRKAADA